MASTTSKSRPAKGLSSTPPSQVKDAAGYMRDYRTRRKLDPRLRLQRKLRMMSLKEIRALEQTANTLLGPKRLPDPANPWAK